MNHISKSRPHAANFLPAFDQPFVLLDDASSPAGDVMLFAEPQEVITASSLADVAPALNAVRAATRQGAHAAGFVSYDAAAAFDPAIPVTASHGPLIWFGTFASPAVCLPANLPPCCPAALR